MIFRSLQPMAVFLALFAALGCQPQIGDSCLRDVDCSQRADRICDTTQPEGYCTQFNCDPTSCPDGEAICIAFSNTPSTAIGCGNLNRPSPYLRNFCMKNCDDDKDCRDGYVCLDLAKDNAWGAEVIQKDPEATTVCVLPSSGEPVPRDAVIGQEENVCRGASSLGVGGAGNSGGAGGSGG